MTHAERLKRLFDGLDRVYGRYRVTEVQDNGKHVGGQGDVKTHKGKITVAMWQEHVDGEQSLGITPIRDDSSCVFGALDVDDYTLGKTGRANVVKKVADAGLPLIPCSTKSGGVHLYLFASEPIAAETMRARLKEMAAVLGFAGYEIFPKQDKILTEKDCGCWINMPYFENGVDRHAVRMDGEAMPLEEFLDYAEGCRRPATFFEEPVLFRPDAFADGPPCLQKLAQIGGFAQGGRSRPSVASAVYAHKAAGKGWRDRLHEINEAVCQPVLSRSEVDGIASSVARKKAYRYRCKDEPLSSHCDGALCRLRAFGVGRDGQGDGGGDGTGDPEAENETFPRMGQLKMLKTVPPIWFWDTVDGRTIEMTTEELQSPRLFQKRCMEALKLCPTMPTQNAWQTFLNEALAHAMEIDAAEDSSEEGQAWELLEKFCTGKVQAQSKKEILLGKPWTFEDVTWFRLSDLRRFMDQQHFRGDMNNVNKLASMLYKRGAEKKFVMFDKTQNKGGNIWGVASFAAQPEMDVPESITKDETPF